MSEPKPLTKENIHPCVHDCCGYVDEETNEAKYDNHIPERKVLQNLEGLKKEISNKILFSRGKKETTTLTYCIKKIDYWFSVGVKKK